MVLSAGAIEYTNCISQRESWIWHETIWCWGSSNASAFYYHHSQVPNGGNERINRLSSCRIIFEESKGIYDDAVKNSGFQRRLVYSTPVDPCSRDKGNNSGTCALIDVGDNNNNHWNRRGRNRNRKIIWFNSPFCKLTNINIGKCFLHLLDKHFNRDTVLSKIFNGNTVKITTLAPRICIAF